MYLSHDTNTFISLASLKHHPYLSQTQKLSQSDKNLVTKFKCLEQNIKFTFTRLEPETTYMN